MEGIWCPVTQVRTRWPLTLVYTVQSAAGAAECPPPSGGPTMGTSGGLGMLAQAATSISAPAAMADLKSISAPECSRSISYILPHRLPALKGAAECDLVGVL